MTYISVFHAESNGELRIRLRARLHLENASKLILTVSIDHSFSHDLDQMNSHRKRMFGTSLLSMMSVSVFHAESNGELRIRLRACLHLENASKLI